MSWRCMGGAVKFMAPAPSEVQQLCLCTNLPSLIKFGVHLNNGVYCNTGPVNLLHNKYN